jgi:hypothetical protein
MAKTVVLFVLLGISLDEDIRLFGDGHKLLYNFFPATDMNHGRFGVCS